MKNKLKPIFEPLIPVHGSTHCLYSIIENKLERLYKNQELIYTLLQRIYNRQLPPQ